MAGYGLSGPGKDVLSYFGFTREHVAATALRLLGREDEANELDKDYEDGHAAGKAMHGADFPDIPRCMSVCTHTIESGAVLVIDDMLEDPRFAGNPLAVVLDSTGLDDAVMQSIAGRLKDDEIEALAAYFSRTTRP